MSFTDPPRSGAGSQGRLHEERPAEPADRPASPRVPAGLVGVAAAVVMLAGAVGVIALVVAGAGDDQPTGPVETVTVELGEFFVEPPTVEVPAGSTLVVEVTNGGEIEHDLNLQGETGTDRLAPGSTQTAELGVISGDTEAWCTVPGHREQGMIMDITAGPPAPEPEATDTTAGG